LLAKQSLDGDALEPAVTARRPRERQYALVGPPLYGRGRYCRSLGRFGCREQDP
jgi:hypothetical protein